MWNYSFVFTRFFRKCELDATNTLDKNLLDNVKEAIDNERKKVNVTGVPETMVQTLYARAKETKRQNAKIKDEIAVELVEKAGL